MKERRSTTLKKQKVLLQFMQTGGNATLSCINANVSKSTFYQWQIDDLNFAREVENILKGIKNCAEDKILASAIQGNIRGWEIKLKSVTKKLNYLDE